jgi:hypothetical protein
MTNEFNPQQAEVKKALNDKYSKLMNNTNNGDQLWTGAAVFILHAFIFAATVFLVASIGTNIIEKMVYGALGVGGSFLLEKMKNTYLERYLNWGFIFADEKMPDNARAEAYKEKAFNGKIVAFIYVVSFALFVWGGINFAKKTVEQPKLYAYDPTFKADYDLKVKSVKYAQDKGAKVTVINELNEQADKAKTKLDSHKAMIDAQNAAISGDSNQEMLLYVCLVVFVGLIVEVSLFKATGLHELKQYKLTKNLNVMGNIANKFEQNDIEQEETAKKQPKKEKNTASDTEENEAKARREYEALEAARRKDKEERDEMKKRIEKQKKDLESLTGYNRIKDDELKEKEALQKELDEINAKLEAQKRLRDINAEKEKSYLNGAAVKN